MYTYTEKLDNSTTLVKTTILDISYNCGCIEKGYGNVFMAVGLYNETLKDGDSCIFTDFNKAQKAIANVFEREFDL